MKCAHCQAPKAGFAWDVKVCADGRKKRSKWLCGPCDVELNRMVLEFLGDPKAAEKLEAYQR